MNLISAFFEEPRERDELPRRRDQSAERIRLAIASWIYRSRKARPTEGMADLYGEPVWDIILDLYINEKSSTSIYVSSLCIGANLPIATCVRYISTLEQAGWVTRTPDQIDHRRVLVSLSPIAAERMDDYFDRLAETWRTVVDDCTGFLPQINSIPTDEKKAALSGRTRPRG